MDRSAQLRHEEGCTPPALGLSKSGERARRRVKYAHGGLWLGITLEVVDRREESVDVLRHVHPSVLFELSYMREAKLFFGVSAVVDLLTSTFLVRFDLSNLVLSNLNSLAKLADECRHIETVEHSRILIAISTPLEHRHQGLNSAFLHWYKVKSLGVAEPYPRTFGW
jgi:hypothetical protein